MDLTDLLEGAKKSKKALRSLKAAALDAGQFELAAKLRDLERETFPDTEDEIYAKNINLALRMSGVNPDLRQSWLLLTLCLKYITHDKTDLDFILPDSSLNNGCSAYTWMGMVCCLRSIHTTVHSREN